jgi:hypothetical protein
MLSPLLNHGVPIRPAPIALGPLVSFEHFYLVVVHWWRLPVGDDVSQVFRVAFVHNPRQVDSLHFAAPLIVRSVLCLSK